VTKNRVTQHRAQSDEKIKNKKLADAKREVHALKKTIGKLQKQLKRALEASAAKEEDPISLAEREGALKLAAIVCPKCGDDTPRHVQLPTGMIYLCKCGQRWKHKTESES
jgi:DNA-directed RNA polymerase subunit M/transcription elongation factor TFIIS